MPQPGLDGLSESVNWAVVSRRLRRFALTLTRREHEADDLTQQTLLTLLAKAPEHAGHYGYARQTMVRLWLDRQRSWRRRVARLTRLAATVPWWHVDRHRAGEAEQVKLVHEAIESLPPQQRAVFALRLVEGLAYAEIAALLGCSVESVRASLHLARRRVRRVLGGES